MTTSFGESFYERFANEAKFQAEFIANPRPYLEEMGRSYPAAADIRVIVSTPQDVALVVGTEEMYSASDLARIPAPIRTVIERSFADHIYKALLISSPVEAIFLESGYRVPDGVRVTAYECSPTEIFFPVWLEQRVSSADELSEWELDGVTGGSGSVLNLLATCGPYGGSGL